MYVSSNTLNYAIVFERILKEFVRSANIRNGPTRTFEVSIRTETVVALPP